MHETTLLQFSIFCFTLSLLLDVPLLHAVWRRNAAWAQQRGTPRRLVDVLGLWRWTWSVLIFDPSPQVTRAMRLLAAASGGLRLLALLVLMSISDLTPRPFAHRRRGGGPRHAHAPHCGALMHA